MKACSLAGGRLTVKTFEEKEYEKCEEMAEDWVPSHSVRFDELDAKKGAVASACTNKPQKFPIESMTSGRAISKLVEVSHGWLA